MEEKISGNTIKQNGVVKFNSPSEVLKSWEGSFSIQSEGSNTIGLRKPQIGAFHAIISHWTFTNQIATVVLPTGTGKTETMLSVFVSERLEKLLIIVPSKVLREQIGEKFVQLGLLRKLGLLKDQALNPIVGIIKKGFSTKKELIDLIQKCNVVVATASIMTRILQEYEDVLKNSFTHIFFDEAHHTEASSWSKLRTTFSNKFIVQFTATPFRNDNKRIDGKPIYSYPLKKAQEEGYFKPIKFEKIYEYSPKNKDRKLAEKGIEILRTDKKKFHHILMARVKTKRRADEVFEIYNEYSSEFRVEKIYSNLTSKESKAIQQRIKNLEVDIIVCVDMLGEGFDLPNLKIAVLHDIKQSLPITLQFIGRFTRTSKDEVLGNATVVANLADTNVNEELELLYARDPDWNVVLPLLSDGKTQKEIELYEYLEGFNAIDDFPISVQSIKPAISTVIFKNYTEGWFPLNYKNGIPNPELYETIKHVYNQEKRILVIITIQKTVVDWTDSDGIYNLVWDYYIIYWNSGQNLLFINSSEKGSLHTYLAKSIIGDKAELITGDNGGKIFRVLSGINRFKLQNVGLSEMIGRFIRFVMRVGTDIEPALSQNQINKAKKSIIFGNGYENGEDVSIGCSYKGRIWSRRRNDIPTLIKWFDKVGAKVLNETINGDEILKGALVAKSLSKRPEEMPYFIDWSEEVYKQSEIRYLFEVDGKKYELYTIDLILINPSEMGSIRFAIVNNEKIIIELELVFYKDANLNSSYKFKKVNPSQKALVWIGTKPLDVEEYFYVETPQIWFVSGNCLEGNNFYELKNIISGYEAKDIEVHDWTGVDINVESQGHSPKKINSIQYKLIETLKKEDYDVIFDDDSPGEVADIITIKCNQDKIYVQMFHIKFAIHGKVNKQVKNLYEVCGQAQKSVNWVFKRGKELLEHCLRRESLRVDKHLPTRFEVGNKDILTDILEVANNKVALEFEVIIVQPSISKKKVTQDQLTLLGVTETYLTEKAALKLRVIGSA